MKKDILFNREATDKLRKGVNTVCDAVKSTLGAGGRVVIIEGADGKPRATKDGVSVAKSIDVIDRFENQGVMLIRDIAEKTVQDAGDGTTTSCVLAQAIINKGFEAIENGANPIELIREIKSSSVEIIKNIRSQSVPIKGDWDRVKQIAVISTNGDEHHASLLVDAMQKIGEDGVVLVEQGQGFETKVEIVKGIEFDSGYLSPYFVNNEKNECVLENPFIFITSATITTMEEVASAINIMASKQRPIVFICNNIDGEGQATLILNRTKGGYPLCAINSPSYGGKRKEHLIDIAIATGASIFGAEFGKEMKLCKESDLGQADRVIITKTNTIIIGGGGLVGPIDQRLVQIRNDISITDNPEEKEWLKSRLAKLSGGVALIKVGGITQVAISELKDRLDDAVCATKAAIESGVVCGGGIAYRSARKMDGSMMDSVLHEPFSQILLNAGLGSVPERGTLDANHGVNARTGHIENFMETGVIDSTRVTISALENAVDVACLILQNNVLITNFGR